MNASNVRYHALDSMRATMMLLGIYLHVVVGYSGDGHWPYIDPHPTGALNFTLGIIHAFRMPAFYVMAGFFGSLLWNGRGPASFIANRVKRVLLPFALFWSLLFPLMAAIVISLEQGTNRVVPAFLSGALLKRLHPLHLWFLEYLLLLYAIGGLAATSRTATASGRNCRSCWPTFPHSLSAGCFTETATCWTDSSATCGSTWRWACPLFWCMAGRRRALIRTSKPRATCCCAGYASSLSPGSS